MTDIRLIERWLPIAELSEESIRERRSMTALPPIYYLHVWWARRPLIASRAAILASVVSENVDHAAFQQALGILGDPVKTRHQIDLSKKTGKDLGLDPYGYKRAFTYSPSDKQLKKLGLQADKKLLIVDPTAGGGSIPFEAVRLGLGTYANDLNPVAAIILKATVEFPKKFGRELFHEFSVVSSELGARLTNALKDVYPCEANGRVDGYLWARTICCPYCSGIIPLSPNWRLNNSSLGVRLIPETGKGPGDRNRVCSFEVVDVAAKQSAGSVSDGDATCVFPDCARVIGGNEVKRQAQAGDMGEQLYAIVYKRRVETKLKSGKSGKPKWQREYRAPQPGDNNAARVKARLIEKMPKWEALDIVPTEEIPAGNKTDEALRYGIKLWRDMFSPRQFLSHGLAAEIFCEMVEEDRVAGRLSDLRKAVFVYVSFCLDKFLNYNSRMSVWMPTREVIANTFNRHDFAFCWSHAEMAIAVEGNGYSWVSEQTGKCIQELVDLLSVNGADGPLFGQQDEADRGNIQISSKSGAALDHITTASVDAVVMDPPYGANVMYAELSDFFYVWLKRSAGRVVPELFTRQLTDKQTEAVANKAHFKGQKGAEILANRDYQEKMAAIFAESRRVLKPNGIMTVMFTHKDTSAWDALTKGLIEAGFMITASWPINTEAEGSLHIKDKAAANSTIFLVCRPRAVEEKGETTYWEDIEPLVAKAVRTRVEEFQKAGIGGVDLYLASFGPALEEFSRHWPLKRGTPRPELLEKKRRKQAELFAEAFDPYAVTPEDALDAARREVKTWRLNQLTHLRGKADLDPATSFYILAWDAFKAPSFAYDEGLRLARAVGADLEQMIGRICEKKGSDIKLWDSATRSAKGSSGAGNGSIIDILQLTAHLARTKSLEVARKFLADAELLQNQQFLNGLEAILEVLPPSKNFANVDFSGDLKAASDDFDALEKLRRLVFADVVDEPKQLKLWTEEAA
jgi:putative DNA methylase